MFLRLPSVGSKCAVLSLLLAHNLLGFECCCQTLDSRFQKKRPGLANIARKQFNLSAKLALVGEADSSCLFGLSAPLTGKDTTGMQKLCRRGTYTQIRRAPASYHLPGARDGHAERDFCRFEHIFDAQLEDHQDHEGEYTTKEREWVVCN